MFCSDVQFDALRRADPPPKEFYQMPKRFLICKLEQATRPNQVSFTLYDINDAVVLRCRSMLVFADFNFNFCHKNALRYGEVMAEFTKKHRREGKISR
jgi:hypothetical protein